jgi:hypothetical protein
MIRWNEPILAACLMFVVADVASAADPATDTREATAAERDKQALSAVQSYVGAWRGVGQWRRGSNQGAWTETSEWGWRFPDGHAELVADLPENRFYSRLRLQATDQRGQFTLLATPSAKRKDDGAGPQTFRGGMKDGALILVADQAAEGEPARITIRLVAGGDRMVTLFEKRSGSDAYSRLAEVGATRKGSSFAKMATVGHECVVTGGLGTIVVEHEGKKYYVCCTGCRDLFNDDPAGVLEEYRQRKAAKKPAFDGN